MPQEIERKFLVASKDWRLLPHHTFSFRQGYFSPAKDYCVRVRIVNDSKAFLTIKGNGEHCLQRPEFEYEIPLDHAQDMMRLFCQNRAISKKRNVLTFANMIWEVDEFAGRHDPLVLAEVELTTPNQQITLPTWLGKEVTDDVRFSNQHLATHGLPSDFLD